MRNEHAADIVQYSSWTSSDKMAEAPDDSMASYSEDAAAAAMGAVATGWF